MKTALIVGATGLIGKQLLDLLLVSDHYTRVTAVVRKPLGIQHAKLKVLIVDFDNLDAHADELKADDVFCCLGTTMKQAKSKDAFRKVDFEYPLEIGRITKAKGASHCLLVSALGADKSSSIFYNKVKGETEQALKLIGFDALHIFRPSLLLGSREEDRAGESAAKVFYKMFGFLIPKKYQAIDSLKIARAMLHFAQQTTPVIHMQVHESASLQNF